LSSSADALRRTKVVVVDDSALIRKVLAEIINGQRDMICVGAAPDPIAARELIRATNPDVITLDVEMPKMDGLDFLERLMRLRPMPVVMVSTLTEKGSEVTLRALELGAVDFVAKPKLDITKGMQEYAAEIAEKIRAAAASKVRGRAPAPAGTPPRILAALGSRVATTEKLIIIGASTGGTEAIKDVLVQFPPDAPGVLVTQHMPEGFTKSFAARLDKLSRITVSEAVHGERILPGHAYIAPGGNAHLKLKRSGANYVVELDPAPPVNKHRPSVDVLFRSAAEVAGANALGVILTGMGKDGAAGMLEMRQAGAYTIAEDESTCVVFGMPREAIAAGGVEEVAPLGDIAQRLFAKLAESGARTIRV
jgi:two-component system, chemotaxis family, protein-glutamate methylesterase/glutaminase